MAIFNQKTLKKHLPDTAHIPHNHQQIIENWVAQINNGTLARLNEIEVHAAFTAQIMCKLLGFSAIGEADNYTVAREYPVARGKVDLALGRFCGDKEQDTVAAAFELKGAKNNLDAMMSGRHKTPVQQAFEYARDIKNSKWVLLSNYVELRLYAVSETSLIYEKFLFNDLLKPDEYAKFQLLLSAQNFLGGKTEQLLKQSESADKDISEKLYRDYKTLRENTLAHLIKNNPQHTPNTLIKAAQKLLDRILFIAFAEDKGLIPDTSIEKAFTHNDPYNPKPIYQNFIGLFNAIDKGNKQLDIPAYNGGLFALDKALDNLVVNDELCEGFKNLAEYDFDSEVSVTVLGHIFEQSIADLEVLSEAVQTDEIHLIKSRNEAKNKGVAGKRKQHGVVYTPDNITAFIVANTLGCHIEQQFKQLFKDYGKYKSDGTIVWKKGKQTELRFWYAWVEILKQIKIVDPACGSGAFLIAAFDYLHSEYEKTNHQIAVLTKAQLTGQHSMLDLNKEILNNNLYGVDINSESIEITKLSLWLKTAQRGKTLPSLDANFIAGNSLGFDAAAPDSDFCWQHAFTEIFEQGGFDVVLGNPPYVRQELLGEIKPWLALHYKVYHGVLDLYGYFFELGLKLLKPGGRLAYISSSTFFKTASGKNLRTLLATQIALEKIIDFGDVQIFEGVTTYPAILVMRKLPPLEPLLLESCKIQIMALKNNLPDNLPADFATHHGLMAQHQLGANSWQLEDQRLHALRQKISKNKNTLKQVYGSPLYGIKTGLNAAFVIDRKTRDDIAARDAGSAEIIKPFLEGKDLKRWHSQGRDLWLIAIPKFWTRQQMANDLIETAKDETISEEEAWLWFTRHYPALVEWLLPFAVRGRKRGDKGEFWWELRACAYYKEFEKNKIQYGHFSPEPLFHYNTNSAYSNDKSYIIPTQDTFLYGLLNSSTFWFLIKAMCPFVRGGFYEVRAQYIETLPIPDKPENETISELAITTQDTTEQRYKCQQNFTRRLPDLCPPGQPFKTSKKLQNWWLLNFAELQKEIKKAFKGIIPLTERNDWQDYFEAEKTRREQLNNKIKQLQQQLDQQVYQLFELTDDEILLVESQI